MAYDLYYWPGLQGRGEFVRLALEQAGALYRDVARGDKAAGQGVPALMPFMEGDAHPHPPFAPPFLKDGDLLVGQTAAILLYLAPKHGLAPPDEAGRLWCNQIQLTLMDLVKEVHDTHHPVGAALYYEDQKAVAARAAQSFRDARLPKYCGWLENILRHNPAGETWLVGDTLTYADLSLFQIVEGLRYAFPRAANSAFEKSPRMLKVHGRVKEQPNIAAYLSSDRRLAFNETGIFRNYPELDG